MASYCTPSDLSQYGIRAEALATTETAKLQAAIVAASDVIDGYLRSRFKLPLAAWGTDITRLCAKIAVYDLILVRGFNSARAGDEQIQASYEDAIQTLRDITNERFTPNVTDSSSGATAGEVAPAGSVQVTSCRSRGYLVEHGCYGGAFQGRLR